MTPWVLTPQTSHLTPHTSDRTPYTSHPTPHASTPQYYVRNTNARTHNATEWCSVHVFIYMYVLIDSSAYKKVTHHQYANTYSSPEASHHKTLTTANHSRRFTIADNTSTRHIDVNQAAEDTEQSSKERLCNLGGYVGCV